MEKSKALKKSLSKKERYEGLNKQCIFINLPGLVTGVILSSTFGINNMDLILLCSSKEN